MCLRNLFRKIFRMGPNLQDLTLRETRQIIFGESICTLKYYDGIVFVVSITYNLDTGRIGIYTISENYKYDFVYKSLLKNVSKELKNNNVPRMWCYGHRSHKTFDDVFKNSFTYYYNEDENVRKFVRKV